MGNSWEIHREQIRNNKTREVELNTKHLRRDYHNKTGNYTERETRGLDTGNEYRDMTVFTIQAQKGTDKSQL